MHLNQYEVANENNVAAGAAGTADRPRLTFKRIVSGGQTGVDRGALDAALDAGFPCGRWCPRGRLAEDGAVPERYPLVELAGAGYEERTLKNVFAADGTAILCVSVVSKTSDGHSCTSSFCSA